MVKVKYKVNNWIKYNKALINRGSVTFWLKGGVITAWHDF